MNPNKHEIVEQRVGKSDDQDLRKPPGKSNRVFGALQASTNESSGAGVQHR